MTGTARWGSVITAVLLLLPAFGVSKEASTGFAGLTDTEVNAHVEGLIKARDEAQTRFDKGFEGKRSFNEGVRQMNDTATKEEDARRAARQAVEQLRRRNPHSPELLRALRNLASLCPCAVSWTNNQADPEPSRLEACEVAKSAFGATSVEYALSLRDLASCYVERNAPLKAWPHIELALDILRSTSGTVNEDYVRTLWQYGKLCLKARQYLNAAKSLSEVLSWFNTAHSLTPVEHLNLLSDLADAYNGQGRPKDAIAVLEEYVSLVLEHATIVDDFSFQTKTQFLASLYSDTGLSTLADEFWQTQISRAEKAGLTPGRLKLRNLLQQLAEHYCRTGRSEQAEQLILTHIPREPDTVMYLSTLASALSRCGGQSDGLAMQVYDLAVQKDSATGHRSQWSYGLYDSYADYCLQRGEFVKAERTALQFAEIHGKTVAANDQIAGPTYQLARIFGSQGQFDKMKSLLSERLSQIRARHGENSGEYVLALNHASGLYQEFGLNVQAFDLAKQAQAIHDRGGDSAKRSWFGGTELPFLLEEIGEFGEAEKAFTKMAEAQRAANPNSGNVLDEVSNGPGETRLYTRGLPDSNLRSFYEGTGNLEAVRQLDESLLSKLRMSFGDASPVFADQLSSVAEENIQIGDIETANTQLRQAMAIYEQAVGTKSKRYGLVLASLADLREQEGETSAAESLLTRYREVMRDAAGERSGDYGDACNKLAELYLRMKESYKAETLCQELLGIPGISAEFYWPRQRMYLTALRNMGQAMALKGDTNAAVRYLNQSITEERKGSYSGAWYSDKVRTLADAYVLAGNRAAADRLYARELENCRKARRRDSVMRYLCEQGNLMRLEEETSEAVARFDEGLAILERMRSGFGSAESRSGIQRLVGEAYSQCAAAQVGDAKVGDALVALERGRARSFTDLLANREMKGFSRLASTEGVLKLERQLAALERQMEAGGIAASDAQPSGTISRAIQDILTSQSAELDAQRLRLVEELRRSDAEQSGLVAADAPTLAEIQGTLDTSVTLVEYWHPGEMEYPGYVKRDELWAFVVRNDSVEFTSIPVSKRMLERTLDDYAELVSSGERNKDDLSTVSAALYGWLVAPVEGMIKTRTVIVVPWGRMFKIPFGALAPLDGHPLGTKHDIVISPTAGLYRYLLKKRASGRESFFAIGNPDTSLSPLPGAEQEVREVGALFPKANVKLRGDATKAMLQSAYATIGKPDIIHLACHGMFNPRAPQFSYLALTPDKDDTGKLEMQEVFGLDWRGISLVTLSACSSGKAKLGAGNDIIGMVRGFIFAGAPSVLCSLWDVDDEATRALMVEFYKQYLAGKSKPEALRLAQSFVCNNPKHPEWSHPYYWAAFVLFGDWQ